MIKNLKMTKNDATGDGETKAKMLVKSGDNL